MWSVDLLIDSIIVYAELGKEPTFDAPLANVTVKVGETALLACRIEFLGKYKVTKNATSMQAIPITRACLSPINRKTRNTD